MDAREKQANEIMEEWGIEFGTYWPEKVVSQKELADRKRVRNLVNRIEKASGIAGMVVRRALDDGAQIVFSRELGNTDGF
ncbi:MAG: hypothetical protein ACI4TE_03300, partial [Alphaproteobacteria bacterium]